MRYPLKLGLLLVPGLLLAATGCGTSGGAENPKVQNPTVKMKPVTPKTSAPGAGGAASNFK